MQRLIYIIIIIFIKIQITQAQQFPLFTNYVVNAFGFNPAVIATQKKVEMRGIYRSQWLGVEGRPQTSMMSLTGRFKKVPLAIGGVFFNDLQGTMTKNGVMGMLAYNQKIDDKTSISVGFSGGYNKVNLRDDVFVQHEPDGVINGAQLGMWIPDLSGGVYFHQEDGLFAGISVPQLYRKKLFFDPSVRRISTTQIVRQYHGIIGYRLKVSDMMSLEPSGMIKISPNVSPQYDASLRAIFNKKFWIGGSFRSEDAVTAMMGIDMDKFMLAYSYDVTTSQLRNASAGSHEVVFALRLGSDKCKDQDKDGVCDKDDKCPTEPGTKETDGCPLPKPEEKKDCPDKDRDGVCDNDDKCPELPGPKDNKGCPTNDRDGDGIRDDIDKCPDIPGNLKNEGCPLSDRDRDGILDDVDPCPDIAGTLENMGCPPANDRDKDGTPDKDDPCPDVAGPKENKGCPLDGDRDKDGVPDSKDDCPNTAGTKENNGCPDVSQDERDIITLTIQNLYFDSDKSIIRPASYKNLNNLALMLKRKKDWKIRIEGHADSRGNKEHNIVLSRNRAEAVKNYLVSRGVAPNLVLTEYFGDSKPVTTEKDKSGLQMNRRVEIEFVFD
jgi:type IX secretion system PorP/SprF family membrane protein